MATPCTLHYVPAKYIWSELN